jgi:hypothetical protein
MELILQTFPRSKQSFFGAGSGVVEQLNRSVYASMVEIGMIFGSSRVQTLRRLDVGHYRN